HPVSVPELAVRVVNDGVVQLVTFHGLAHGGQALFQVELGRVHADDDQHAAVLFFQPDQVGENVEAVNSAAGPEFEDDDLAAEVAQAEGPVGPQPAGAAVEFGGEDAAAGLAPRAGLGVGPSGGHQGGNAQQGQHARGGEQVAAPPGS